MLQDHRRCRLGPNCKLFVELLSPEAEIEEKEREESNAVVEVLIVL